MDFEVQSQYRTARELNVTLTLDVNQVKEDLRIINKDLTKINQGIIVQHLTKDQDQITISQEELPSPTTVHQELNVRRI